MDHILPIGQEVQLRSEKNKETPRPKRKASKRLNAKRTENCLLVPEQHDKRESASDSEEEEMGVWYDYHPLRESQEPESQNNEHSEPFSLDLDLAVLTNNSEREAATAEEPAAADEDEHSVQNQTVESTVEDNRDTETQMIDETTERRDSVTEISDEAT